MAFEDKSKKRRISILFVCTGNIIRSAMAKAFLEDRLPSALKERVHVDSAGVSAIDGNRSTDEAIWVMAEKGIDLSGHRAKFLSHDLITASDLILVMEKSHLHHLSLFYRSGKKEIRLLRALGPKKLFPDSEVPDPYGKSLNSYRASRDLIEASVDGVIAWIEEKEKE